MWSCEHNDAMLKGSGGLVLAAIACVLLSGSAPAARAATPPSDEAEQILETAGIRAGVIVHLGCGDGRLTIVSEGPLGVDREEALRVLAPLPRERSDQWTTAMPTGVRPW